MCRERLTLGAASYVRYDANRDRRRVERRNGHSINRDIFILYYNCALLLERSFSAPRENLRVARAQRATRSGEQVDGTIEAYTRMHMPPKAKS